MRNTPDLDASNIDASAPRLPRQRGKCRARRASSPVRSVLPTPRRRAPAMLESLPAIVAEFGVVMVPTSRRRRPGETHASGALAEILREHGSDHLRQVLRLVRETRPNREALWSEIFAAVSDVLVAFPAWKKRESDLSKALDTLCLQKAREKAVSLRPWPVRGSLRVLLWIALEKHMGPA